MSPSFLHDACLNKGLDFPAKIDGKKSRRDNKIKKKKQTDELITSICIYFFSVCLACRFRPDSLMMIEASGRGMSQDKLMKGPSITLP